jgi:hypothetical protein
LSIVSGIPARERHSWVLVMWEAYVDESGFDGKSPAYVLAASVAPVAHWLGFADDWDKALRMRPRIEYFKANEAMRLRGEFLHWSKESRDEKVAILRGVISDHNVNNFTCSVPRADFHRVVDSSELAKRQFGTPYRFLFWKLIPELMQHLDDGGVSDRVKFVFDQQVMEQFGLLSEWQTFYERTWLGQKLKKRIAGTPAFEDDKKFLPLQAADLAAWICCRRYQETENGEEPLNLPKRPSEPSLLTNLNLAWNEASMRAELSDLRWNLSATIKISSA